jgi:hypothetical protein
MFNKNTHQNVRILSLLQVGNALLRQKKSAASIHRVHQIVFLHWSVECASQRNSRGIVAANVNSSKHFDGLFDRVLNGSFITNIDSTWQGLSTSSFNFFGDLNQDHKKRTDKSYRIDSSRKLSVLLSRFRQDCNVSFVLCKFQRNGLKRAD